MGEIKGVIFKHTHTLKHTVWGLWYRMDALEDVASCKAADLPLSSDPELLLHGN